MFYRCLLICALLSSCQKKSDFDEGIGKINHVVVIYMENHSLPHLARDKGSRDHHFTICEERLCRS
jgi:hypothetical protein